MSPLWPGNTGWAMSPAGSWICYDGLQASSGPKASQEKHSATTWHCVRPRLSLSPLCMTSSQSWKPAHEKNTSWWIRLGLKVRQELPQTHFHMFKSMSSSKFTGLCNYWYHHNPILEKCHLPKRLPQACWQFIAIPTASPRSGCLLCVLPVPPCQVLSLFPSIHWTEGSPTSPGKRHCLYHQPSCRGWTQMHTCMYPHTCTHTHYPGNDVTPSPSSPSERSPTLLQNASNPSITGMATVFKSCRKIEYYPPQ